MKIRTNTKNPRKHWRVVIQLVEIRSEIDQPVMEDLSLPGVFTAHKGWCLFKVVCEVASVLRKMGTY